MMHDIRAMTISKQVASVSTHVKAAGDPSHHTRLSEHVCHEHTILYVAVGSLVLQLLLSRLPWNILYHTTVAGPAT